jgi:hypothetical protein
MSEETTSALAICHLSGEPQDGARCSFDLLPIMLVDEHDGGYYSQTTERTRDGAFVFEYHSPEA